VRETAIFRLPRLLWSLPVESKRPAIASSIVSYAPSKRRLADRESIRHDLSDFETRRDSRDPSRILREAHVEALRIEGRLGNKLSCIAGSLTVIGHTGQHVPGFGGSGLPQATEQMVSLQLSLPPASQVHVVQLFGCQVEPSGCVSFKWSTHATRQRQICKGQASFKSPRESPRR